MKTIGVSDLFWGVGIGVVVLLGVVVWPKPHMPVQQDAHVTPPPFLMEGVHIQGFDEGNLRVEIRAARGHPSRKRVGFLQTALIPTVELEDVDVTRPHADGTMEQATLPAAIIDWPQKRFYSRSGKPLFENH